eukprot:11311275-Alexandrium_andersonii.AAC.1
MVAAAPVCNISALGALGKCSRGAGIRAAAISFRSTAKVCRVHVGPRYPCPGSSLPWCRTRSPSEM